MVIHSLEEVLPEYKLSGIAFNRIELLEEEASPLALVWYTGLGGTRGESAARIDIQKQVFLDDFGTVD